VIPILDEKPMFGKVVAVGKGKILETVKFRQSPQGRRQDSFR